MVVCLPLDNTIGILNNKYILNNRPDISGVGLCDTSNVKYKINNIPENHPLGFAEKKSGNILSDVSHIVSVYPKGPIIYYVEKSFDESYDKYRFYNDYLSLIDNLKLMKDVSYQFKSTSLTGNDFIIRYNTSEFSLNSLGVLEYKIPYNANNTDNSLLYKNNDGTITDNLEILTDNSCINYYFGDINFDISSIYSTPNYLNTKISLIEFPNPTINVSNINILRFSDRCEYVVNTERVFQDICNNYSAEVLTRISQARLINNSYYEFNFRTHRINIPSNIPNYFILNNKRYTIIDISNNFPIRIKYTDSQKNLNIDQIIKIDENYDETIIKFKNNVNYYCNNIILTVNIANAIDSDISLNIEIYDEINSRVIETSNNLRFDSNYELTLTGTDTINSQYNGQT